MTNSLRKWTTPVSAKRYRIITTISLVVTVLFGICMFIFAEMLPRYGHGETKSGELTNAFLPFLMNFMLPAIAIVVLYLSVRGWDECKKDKICRWQGWLSSGVIVVICIIVVVYLLNSFVWANYVELIEGESVVDDTQCDLRLPGRIAALFTYLGPFFIPTLSFGLFSRQ